MPTSGSVPMGVHQNQKPTNRNKSRGFSRAADLAVQPSDSPIRPVYRGKEVLGDVAVTRASFRSFSTTVEILSIAC